MNEGTDVLIVGAGHGGAQAAIALRQRKFAGTITVVGEEPEMPYERPALSKDYLAGAKDFDRILIRPPAFWTQRDVTFLTDRRVVSIDAAAHSVTLADDSRLRYGQLIWAAGGRPRRLSCDGHDLGGVHSVRSRADVDRMKGELVSTRRVVVVGGGYVGLEAAAVLSSLGKQVTVLEAMDRVLARVAGEELSRFYEAQHRAHGVEIRLCVAVECLEGLHGRVSGVRLRSGEVIAADMVIVGIGIVPAVEPLLAAGAAGANGVLVDPMCRTSLHDVFAIGDCALHSNPYADGASIRLESVQNATDMAMTAAKAMTGDAQPYDILPWFWSNQFDLRLQTIGLSAGHDRTEVRGDITARSFAIVYRKQDRVVALDCVNATKEFAQGKALLTKLKLTMHKEAHDG